MQTQIRLKEQSDLSLQSTLFAIPLSILRKNCIKKQNLGENRMELSVRNFRTFTVLKCIRPTTCTVFHMQPAYPCSLVSVCYLHQSTVRGPDKGGYLVNIFISPQKHMLWYSLEAPWQGTSNEYPQHMFSWRNKKNTNNFGLKKAPLVLNTV